MFRVYRDEITMCRPDLELCMYLLFIRHSQAAELDDCKSLTASGARQMEVCRSSRDLYSRLFDNAFSRKEKKIKEEKLICLVYYSISVFH